MNAVGNRLSPGAIHWLLQILKERFGYTFELREVSPSALSLELPGHAQAIVFERAGTRFDHPPNRVPCARWDAALEGWHPALGKPLFAPGARHLPKRVIEPTVRGHSVHYDVPGLIRWALGRFEEVGSKALDRHGRFPATASHAHRHGYLERPIVDEWLDIWGQVITRTWPSLPLPRREFKLQVSHDVDWPSRYGFGSPVDVLRLVGADVVRRRDFRSWYRAPRIWLGTRSALHPRDPYNTFDWILEVSERLGLRSAFYFLCGRTNPKRDALYEPDHPAMVALMREIHERGHEIGLHPSYGTYQTPSAIRAEARRLKQICAQAGIVQAEWGGRMHFLRWQTPITLEGWIQAEMTYDSSLGYADRPGFRAGTCFEYPAFDPLFEVALPLRLRPLVAMEGTIIGQRYLGLGTGAAALSQFLTLKQACRGVGGSFTLLWHNSHLTTPAARELYQTVLTA
jgi:hypothetical protein